VRAYHLFFSLYSMPILTRGSEITSLYGMPIVTCREQERLIAEG
jgi:hypothetical protein